MTQPETNPATLTGKQRRYLRSLGHHLEVVVQLGKGGLTDGTIDAATAALETHELIKVRRSGDCPASRKEVAIGLGNATGAHVVQQLGHTVLLYRRRSEEPAIELPRA